MHKFQDNEEGLFTELRHVSGLVDITALQPSDIRFAIKQAREVFERAAHRRPWFKAEGAFELELVDFKHMDRMSPLYSPEKKTSLEDLLSGTLTRPMYGDDEMVVLVHWHALMVGLDDTTGLTREGGRQSTRGSAFSVLRKHYHRHRQLYVQPLRRPKVSSTIAKDISKICSYPFKNAYRLKYTFEGSDYQNGEYVDFKTLGEFIHVYRQIGRHGNKGLQISYGSRPS
ncbi:hypothetical protein FY036_03430 [Mesorhizobium microcysteis]|uniref:Uncharacterized protein n=1 Tax=Neoaquamicrobium microcysteis TaxID=2682781 RepID=A0A5D4H612_9HYPH|nr:hypothetical protein [Mesorhizobium microcysteis]TYR34885.1 hypothetical protein FY036_03430 [Mesorhizobium microcysteis]